MYSKTFRAISVSEAGDGRWRVHFREVMEQSAPGAPEPLQDSFSLAMSLEEARATLGSDQTVTIEPVVVD